MDWPRVIQAIKDYHGFSDYTLRDRMNHKSPTLLKERVTQNKIFRWRHGISEPGYHEGKRLERMYRDLPEDYRK